MTFLILAPGQEDGKSVWTFDKKDKRKNTLSCVYRVIIAMRFRQDETCRKKKFDYRQILEIILTIIELSRESRVLSE